MPVRLTCSLPDWSITIDVNESMRSKVEKLFSEFNQEDVSAAQKADIISTSEGCVTYGIRNYSTTSEQEVLFHVFEGVDYITKNSPIPYTLLHGGAVAINDIAIGLIAPTHTGKSTTVAELLLRGAKFLCDDYLILDDQLFAHPFPFPLRLRDISVLSSSESFSILHEGVHPYSHEHERIINIAPYIQKNPAPLQAIFLLNRQAFGEPFLKRLTHAEAYETLLLNAKSCRESAIKQVIYASLKIAAILPVYELTFSDLRGVDLIWKTITTNEQ